ncbi:type II toxin-antitoxin system RelE/ParE family toxin [Candidatus Poriferisodalis sp.]|uniref:type II toxin-antitoxin system RelE/ParE family toxin n=1 Tax=Candidatus Poriferisodalis sp. TaxID=3101277 RepID=UPI003B0116AC
MIRSFRHRGLRALYTGRQPKGVNPEHTRKLTRILGVLDHSTQPRDMDLPGFRLHALSGDLKGHYAVSVSGDWRVTFRFEDGHAADVNYVDYH